MWVSGPTADVVQTAGSGPCIDSLVLSCSSRPSLPTLLCPLPLSPELTELYTTFWCPSCINLGHKEPALVEVRPLSPTCEVFHPLLCSSSFPSTPYPYKRQTFQEYLVLPTMPAMSPFCSNLLRISAFRVPVNAIQKSPLDYESNVKTVSRLQTFCNTGFFAF